MKCPDRTSTLSAVNNLSSLYRDRGKLAEAEQMYVQALAWRERALVLTYKWLEMSNCNRNLQNVDRNRDQWVGLISLEFPKPIFGTEDAVLRLVNLLIDCSTGPHG